MQIESSSVNLLFTCKWYLVAVSYHLNPCSVVFRNLAFEDSEWKVINQRMDAFYVLEGLPPPIINALMPPLTPSENSSIERPWAYARGEHLLELQGFIKKHPLASTERIIAWAGNLLQKEERLMHLLEEREQSRKKRRRTREGDGEQSNFPAGELPYHSASAPEEEAGTSDSEPSVLVVPKRTVQGFSTDDLLQSSPVAQSKILRSTSSKLNYILNEVWRPLSLQFNAYALFEVLKYSKDEKLLIFSNSPLTLAMISDGLQLIHVDGLLCSSQIKPAERFQRIVTYETSDTYRVLLMELKHGARGLSVKFFSTNYTLHVLRSISVVMARN